MPRPNANNGTYLGGPLLGVPGKFLNAVLMDSVNDYVRVPSAASLDVGDTFSIEGWVKRTSTAKSEDLFNKGGNGFQLTVMSAPNANQVFLRKANVSTVVRSTAGVAAGAYHHIVATKNGAGAGTSKIYIDGAEAGTVAVSAAQVIQNNTQPLLFGMLNSSSIDEFAVYDRALTAAEVVRALRGRRAVASRAVRRGPAAGPGDLARETTRRGDGSFRGGETLLCGCGSGSGGEV